MDETWYIESYGEKGIDPDGSFHCEGFAQAIDEVKAVLARGENARFLAPSSATKDQIDQLFMLGTVERI